MTDSVSDSHITCDVFFRKKISNIKLSQNQHFFRKYGVHVCVCLFDHKLVPFWDFQTV